MSARGLLKLRDEAGFCEALRELDRFSHIWVIFVFDRHVGQAWTPTIEPPRVQGPRRVGVLASRSPHRPNPIGLSVVKLDRIDWGAKDGIELHLSGVDILDGTPVLDIKPYLPYADDLPEALSGWVQGEIRRFAVNFSGLALAYLEAVEGAEALRDLVVEMLQWDPRPRSQRERMPMEDPRSEGREFAFRVMGRDVRWQIRGGEILVTELLDDPA